VGDELAGRVTKVVTFGAFVEVLDGVEGLAHISELAQHHVENPREVVNQGDEIRVRILEIDSDRRRLSLSVKRVEDQMLPLDSGEPSPGAEPDSGDLDEVPELGLSDDVFAGDTAARGEGSSVLEGGEPVVAEPVEDLPEAAVPADEVATATEVAPPPPPEPVADGAEPALADGSDPDAP
jgi:small subunit ribosomal protein S1